MNSINRRFGMHQIPVASQSRSVCERNVCPTIFSHPFLLYLLNPKYFPLFPSLHFFYIFSSPFIATCSSLGASCHCHYTTVSCPFSQPCILSFEQAEAETWGQVEWRCGSLEKLFAPHSVLVMFSEDWPG